jgi:hypothetical protein
MINNNNTSRVQKNNNRCEINKRNIMMCISQFNYIFFYSFFHAADLSRCQRTLAKSLNEFNFECIGSTQTDDEQVIAASLKQFSKLISAIEDERDNMV